LANCTTEISVGKSAIVAGFGLLIMTIFYIFADFFIFKNLIVPGDATTTANNIIANEMLFRTGICSFLIVIVCDVVVAQKMAVFAFSEVKLGIVPAVISTYVIPKIGVSHARSLFVTGERFSAEKAYEIGLVHKVCTLEELDTTTEEYVTLLAASGPHAVTAVKEMIQTWSKLPADDYRTYTAQLIADLRASKEGKEGIKAFLEKRKPVWR